MKKIILTLLFSLTLFANTESCKLDIYYGNGVWNDEESAKISKDELKFFMQINFPDKFAQVDEGVTYSFKYAHNETYGVIDDLIETHWQLYESGQISELYFSFVARVLNVIDPDGESFRDRIKNIITQYSLDAVTMLNNYRTNSFNNNNNVLLVAHSQGNLFGNEIYGLLSDDEKEKFQMVSVATPANNVIGDYSINAPYTTLHGDLVIKLFILNSLAANADGFGHSFVESYLYNPIYESVQSIVLNIAKAVERLDENSCKLYQYYRWIAYDCSTRQDTELEVDIYGYFQTAGTTIGVEHVATDVRQRVALENGTCPLLGLDDHITYTSNYDKDGCSAYAFTYTTIYSIESIYDTQYQNLYTCTTYNMSLEVATKLNDMQEY